MVCVPHVVPALTLTALSLQLPVCSSLLCTSPLTPSASASPSHCALLLPCTLMTAVDVCAFYGLSLLGQVCVRLEVRAQESYEAPVPKSLCCACIVMCDLEKIRQGNEPEGGMCERMDPRAKRERDELCVLVLKPVKQGSFQWP